MKMWEFENLKMRENADCHDVKIGYDFFEHGVINRYLI